MKKLRAVITLTLALAFALSLGITTNARAAEFKAAYVNLQWALNMSEKGKESREELNIEKEKIEKKLMAKQDELKEMRDEIEKQRPIWNKETVEKKEAEFIMLGKEFQKEVAEADETFSMARQEVESSIIDGLRAVVKEIAEDRGYDFVFEVSAGGIIYAKDDADITEETIKKFDKKKN